MANFSVLKGRGRRWMSGGMDGWMDGWMLGNMGGEINGRLLGYGNDLLLIILDFEMN